MAESDKTPQRAILSFCYRHGKSPVDATETINSTYGEGTVNRRLVYRWYKSFGSGDESLEDRKRAGRPVEQRNDANVSIMHDAINEDRRSTLRSFSKSLGMSYGSVQQIHTEDLKMRRISARWVPRLLSDHDMERRVTGSRKFLKRWKREGMDSLRRIVTVDETWVYFYDPESKAQSSQWKRTTSPPPKKARSSRTVGKHMFIVFFDMDGVVLSHAVPKGQSMNAAYYSKVLNRDLMTAFRKKRPHFYDDLSRCILHHDNATAHTAHETMINIDLHGMEVLPHPPYSSDLAPCDFALFPHLKQNLRVVRHDDLNELKTNCNNIFKELPNEWFINVFMKWVEPRTLH